MIDIALTENDERNGVVAHTLDCPVVQQHREEGREIASLYGIAGPLDPSLPQHSCLKKK